MVNSNGMKEVSIKFQTIEWLRFVCAILVVQLHATFSPWDKRELYSFSDGICDCFRVLFSQGLCRVAVPIFFLISGYLFFLNLQEWEKKIWLKKVKRRVRTLVIPYLLWNIIAMLFTFFLLFRFWLLKGGEKPDIVAWFDSIGGLASFYCNDTGSPFNYPLWFVRNLIILVIISPIIYYYVKKFRFWGLSILAILYMLDFWPSITGLESTGFMFFSLGALFSIFSIDFSIIARKSLLYVVPVSIVVLGLMLVTFGDRIDLWQYIHRLFTIVGSFAMIGLTVYLFEKKVIFVKPLLSDSSFFIYAGHSFVLSAIQDIINKSSLPNTQFVLLLKYFFAPFITIAILLLIYLVMKKITPKTLALITGGR